MTLLDSYNRGIVKRSTYIRMCLTTPRHQLGDSYEVQLPIAGVDPGDTFTEAASLILSEFLNISLSPFTVTWLEPELLPSYSPEAVKGMRVSGQGYLYFALGAENITKSRTQQVDPRRLTSFYGMTNAEVLAELGRLLNAKTCTTDINRLSVQWLNKSAPAAGEFRNLAEAVSQLRQEINSAISKIPTTGSGTSTEAPAALATIQQALDSLRNQVNTLKPAFSLFIDCGRQGGEPALLGGNLWLPDAFFQGGGWGDNGESSTKSTDIPQVYKSERYGASIYSIPVPEGSYRVSLYFAENYFNNIGDRVFNIRLQNQTVLTNFDILKEAGGRGKAIIRSFQVAGANIKIEISDPGTIMGISIVGGAESAEHTHPVSEIEQLAAELNNLVEEINDKQPRGNYATAQGLIDAIALLQTAINQKQPAGNYAPANHEQAISSIIGLQQALTEIMQAVQTRAEQVAVENAIASLQAAIDQKQPLGEYPTKTDLTNSFAIEATTTATLLNSWTRYGITYGNPGYYKTPVGEVVLVGAIKGGTLGVAAITLPEGYRPRANKFFQVFSSTSTNTMVLAYAEVRTDGSVIPMTGNNVCFSLEGIRFRTT